MLKAAVAAVAVTSVVAAVLAKAGSRTAAAVAVLVTSTHPASMSLPLSQDQMVFPAQRALLVDRRVPNTSYLLAMAVAEMLLLSQRARARRA